MLRLFTHGVPGRPASVEGDRSNDFAIRRKPRYSLEAEKDRRLQDEVREEYAGHRQALDEIGRG